MSDPIDIYVGERLYLLRLLSEFSQTELGEKVSLTYQQIQKYERGTNRISASKIVQFSRVLGIPISAFFEGLEEEGTKMKNVMSNPELMTHQASRLARNFMSIDNPATRRRIVDLVESITGTQDECKTA